MMKKSILIIILLAITTVSFVKAAGVDTNAIPYDSLKNFVGDQPQQYIGQELYVKGLPDNTQELGYSGFVLDYKKDDVILNDKKNVYQVGDGYNSRYDTLVGKYFKVVDVIPHPLAKENMAEYGHYFYLRLKSQTDKNDIYYRYDSRNGYSFPFIVIGFYDKHRALLFGKEFIFTENALNGVEDLKTGKPIKNTSVQKWKCFRMSIDPEKYQLSLVMQNSRGERILIPYDLVDPLNKDERKAYTVEEADTYRKKFGKNNFDRVLENMVRTGMTKEMCRLSWGEPTQITKEANNTEIWDYPAGLLTFKGDKLTQTK